MFSCFLIANYHPQNGWLGMDPKRVFVSLTEFAEAQSFLFSDPLRGKDQKKDSSLNGKFDVIRSGKLRLSIKSTV